MARTPLLSRFRRAGRSGPPPPTATGGRPPPARRAVTPGQLRRERRALLRAREDRVRDLGGLMLEMYKQDRFNYELVAEYCAELVGIDEQIEELDGLLVVAVGARGAPVVEGRCACGAPIVAGSHFCANCGRPVGERPVVACRACGNPLPADARFCGSCGHPAGTIEPSAPADAVQHAPAPAAAPRVEPPPDAPVDDVPPETDEAPSPDHANAPSAADRWER